MTEPVLEVENLSVRYGRVEAVRDVSFSVAEGSLVTLVGANGAGKSTIINAVSGIVRPHSGRVRFRGADITRAPAHKLVARGLVQVPEGRQILASLTVAENLAMGGWHRGRGAARTIDEMYQRFGVLAERRDLPAGTLSGGEQQMLAIARALVAEPVLLLLDEPSMGLAPLVVNEVFDVVEQIRATGTTVVLVEQNARRALRAASDGYVLRTGQVVRSGPAAELLADDDVVRAYLGTA
ncbi:ABC transporter ATP-binding protein [Promicromonospora iranensis]|uniref:Branched-chain amino acid transport system ATP-binding protein n=1 Tax=Promicromonospora iranensis TaxID=1105144 RepID=A0ABU2CK12_9MICO|nr:ABC transporter ATP-binding protein [Promicromonospora iranensis]MDR7381633.1 branched-chain amino acid transport system ATP-binding protein [Promicromonospora iranensis]